MALIAMPFVAASPYSASPGVKTVFLSSSSLSSSSSSSSFPSNDSLKRSDSMVKIGGGVRARACLFNPSQEPILKEALKEPVAFAGGILAGLLRLDLNEDPLKEWVARTVEASGITEEEISNSGGVDEEIPQQIEIE